MYQYTLDQHISRFNNKPQMYKFISSMLLDKFLDKEISREEYFDLDTFMRTYSTNWVIEIE